MGESNRLKEEIESMSEEKARYQLDSLEKLIELNKYSIDSKKRELNELKKDDMVRKYITLDSMIQSLEEDGEKTKYKIRLLKQKLCDHNIVYLVSLYKKRLLYRPDLKCLNCGCELHKLNDNQICINEKYVIDDEDAYRGNEYEYNELSNLYKDYLSDGLTEDQISTHLQKEIKKRHKGKQISLRLVRQKKETL